METLFVCPKIANYRSNFLLGEHDCRNAQGSKFRRSEYKTRLSGPNPIKNL